MKCGLWSRRGFMCRAAAGLAVAGVAGNALPSLAGSPELDDLATLKSLHVWDGRTHLIGFSGSTPRERMEDMLRFADRMGVERMCVFLGMKEQFHVGAEGMRQQNDEVMEALKYSNGRTLGYAFIDPFHDIQACLDEVNRCVRDGPMVGLKFEYDTLRHPNEQPGAPTYGAPRPLDFLDPIFERAGELKAVIMHHTWINTLGPEDTAESTPMEVAALARWHPSVTVVCGHTGGKWELGIRAIRGVKNVYADLCGSDPTAGYTEMAVWELGPEHVMYGSDVGGRSFASQLGKVMGADISDSNAPPNPGREPTPRATTHPQGERVQL